MWTARCGTMLSGIEAVLARPACAVFMYHDVTYGFY